MLPLLNGNCYRYCPSTKSCHIGHIAYEQRYTIALMLSQGEKQCEIANLLGKHKLVISREISRNSDKQSNKYCDELAEIRSRLRHSIKAKSRAFTAQT